VSAVIKVNSSLMESLDLCLASSIGINKGPVVKHDTFLVSSIEFEIFLVDNRDLLIVTVLLHSLLLA